MIELILRIALAPQPSTRPTRTPYNQAGYRFGNAADEGRSLLAQRYGRYVAGSAGHRERTPPDLAATLIDRYSSPGDLVVDPFAGTGTMLVEAIHAGRNAIGMDIEPGWVSIARANLALAAQQGATGTARVIHADAPRLPARVPAGLRGTVDLVVASAPAGTTMPTYRRGRHQTGAHAPGAGSAVPRRVGRVAASVGLGQVLAGCATLLRPGGQAVVAFSQAPAHRPQLDGEPSHVVLAARRAGLVAADYLFANHRGQLLTRYPGDDLTAPPRAITGAVLVLPAVAAHDIVVFAKPDQTGAPS